MWRFYNLLSYYGFETFEIVDEYAVFKWCRNQWGLPVYTVVLRNDCWTTIYYRGNRNVNSHKVLFDGYIMDDYDLYEMFKQLKMPMR